MSHRFFAVLFFLFLICRFVVGEEITVFTNIPYTTDGGERQQLDLYLPAGYKESPTPLPLILVIHGGGWTAGDKYFASGFAGLFAQYGMATAGINYRLLPDHLFPTQIIDCKSAVRWLRAHADEYNIDSRHFGAMGHSAGGHLSALLGTTAEMSEYDIGEYLDRSSGIQAVVNFCGPTNFASWSHDTSPMFGGRSPEQLETARKTSPALQVTAASAPMLTVHAIDDELVLIEQGRELHDALKKSGVPTELVEIPVGTGGHSSEVFNSDETRRKIVDFYSRHLKRPKVPQVVIGPPGIDGGRTLIEPANRPDEWKESRCGVAGGTILTYADHNLHRQISDDAELTDLFTKLRQIDIPLELEVGAVKPWGKTGTDCFEKQKPIWERFLRAGALIQGISMDEPLTCCYNDLEADMEYAAEETADFIARVREDYPFWTIGDVEGFPVLSADELIRWVDLLENKLKERGIRGLDFFRIDTDWMHFVHDTGKGSWNDLKRIENHCRAKSIPFSVIYWAANYPAMQKLALADDSTWYVGTLQMGHDYASVGGAPDQFVIESWVGAPSAILPENADWTFMRSARDFIKRFVK